MSELRAATISNLAGTGPVDLTGQYAAKAWVNFNGTGTVAIRESGNVSSITDNGVGIFTTNFVLALSDANYSSQVICGTGVVGNQGNGPYPANRTATSYQFGNYYAAGAVYVDRAHNHVAIFR